MSNIDDMVKTAKGHGMTAIGLTDHGVMYGAIDFYTACKKNGIKPIIVVEAYVANRSRFQKEAHIDNKRYHLTLLAKDNTGYQNLIKLTTAAHTEGYYYKPRVDKDLLRTHSEGLIALSGCPGSELGRAIQSGNKERAEEVIKEYQSIFGPENYYLEIMHHPDVEFFQEWKNTLIEFSRKLNIPLVATQDSHYLHPDDALAHKTLVAISTNTDISDTAIFSGQGHYHFISTEEALEWFKDIPEAVENTEKIAERCNVDLTLGKFIFPDFVLEAGKTADQMLDDLTKEGLQKHSLGNNPEVEERRLYELEIIKNKDYAPYFLVVADLIRFARESKIYTTVRGSVAGSIVAFLSGIVNVNPIEFQLPFERFLNPFRPSAPDIDMDFADNRRHEIIEYAKKKYGADKVAQIGTFGTMLARGAVRDVARATGKSYETGDKIAKLIPMGSQGFPMTIKHAMEIEPQLKELYERDLEARQILDIAKKLEGTVRHVSVHAAGVVIAPKPLTEYVPLQFDPKGEDNLITQYDMYSITDEYGGVGLLKFDFLGIKNLSILADAVARVKKRLAHEIDIENVPINDAKTFEMLARGETEGTFQLNGSGMTRWLKELKPSTIHDINAMVALYRPGPMETIPQYIERKHNPRLVRFVDERMKEYLDFSYGLLVYQDDVLLTAIKLAGYSWLQADTLRKAMGKKVPEIMQAEKEKLLKGFQEFGKLGADKAEVLWKLIEPFAAYGFNKAHAASYGKVAYQTAYMKANYPVDYMAAVLTADAGDTEAIAIFVAECKRMNIEILPPDVRESGTDFTVVSDHAIRFGLTSIKNFGEGVSQAILGERMARGTFNSITDFLARVGTKNLNRKSLESLIRCGALDSFEERGTLLENIEALLTFHRDVTAPQSQDSLFGNALFIPTALILTAGTPISLKQKLDWEKELLGMYVSGHPLDAYNEALKGAKLTIGAIKSEPRPGLPVVLPVLVAEARTILTKSGEKMAFIKFTDKTGDIEGVVFPRLYKERGTAVTPGACLLIKGSVSNRNGELSLAIENLKAL